MGLIVGWSSIGFESLFKTRLKINCIDNYWHKHMRIPARGKWSEYMGGGGGV